MSTTQTRVYLARLAGTGVFDSLGDQVGKIRDVVVTPRSSGRAPIVTGFVVEVAPRRRIFVPEEILVVAQLLDHRVTLIETGEQVTIHDIGMSQERNLEWNVSRLFIRKAGAGFGRRGTTLTVPWNEVLDLFSQ
ncbi:MAG: hypothetical protein JZU67_06480, partial [Burkholderiaceae bacterium]|nr:hypothetical protein [Burkholderiaceae bacterium]